MHRLRIHFLRVARPGALEFVSTDALAAALAKTTGALLGERHPGGHWTGKLSSSALSTATAVCALGVHRRDAIEEDVVTAPLILRGLDWLSRHVNPDGGWGDTDMSISNLSTTTLCWAAFGAADESRKYAQTVNRAEAYLQRVAGGIDQEAIARAVTARYGNDRTFSVPILVTCALSGRFGRGTEAWRKIRPLPFELGALRREWFGPMRLPVVSYALPALIALGQVIHHYRPSLNPLTRWLRNITRPPTLRVLSEIQPSNGGFLEATPLTSFVTMSLAAAGLANHSVTLKGIEFLARSVQDDGSWPIDTNLSTWLTTLSINAMPGQLDFEDRRRLRAWLLAQQFRSPHSYTNAAPGGWAWTDLPGGAPDADDTAGALLALHNLGSIDATVRSAALAGIRWLLDLQNRDGGIPTFCRGWGALAFDRSSPDLTAHAVRAWSIWLDELPAEAPRLRRAIARAVSFLAKTQRDDGSWLPLWFGNQYAPDDTNPTYGTARVVLGLHELAARRVSLSARMLEEARQWLVHAQNPDGSWGGFPKGSPSVEETALAVEALASLPCDADTASAVSAGVGWLLEKIESSEWLRPSPIGLYFAKLWYYEQLYPMIFTVAALARARDYLARSRQLKGRGSRPSVRVLPAVS
jgi:squalene-hopene/tetraprenyl-beta-curcumene cyclase